MAKTKGIPLNRTARIRTLPPALMALLVTLPLSLGVASARVADGGDAARKTSSTCPLTGTKGRRSGPAAAVRIDNSSASRPQAGLAAADVVFETLVEGGLTRYIAVYHCKLGATVGPVRSARFDDAEIVGPFTRALAASGAADEIAQHLDDKLLFITEGDDGDGLFRDPQNPTGVLSLRADVSTLRSVASAGGLVGPGRPFPFGPVQPAAKKARGMTLRFSGGSVIDYSWRKNGWVRSEGGTVLRKQPGGAPLKVKNVLVQVVRVNESDDFGDGTWQSPSHRLTGKGDAFLFRNNRALKGQWSDAGPGAPVFKTNGGKRFRFAPGSIWIALLPSRTGGDFTGFIKIK